jgi:hypothetical protein
MTRERIFVRTEVGAADGADVGVVVGDADGACTMVSACELLLGN